MSLNMISGNKFIGRVRLFEENTENHDIQEHSSQIIQHTPIEATLLDSLMSKSVFEEST